MNGFRDFLNSPIGKSVSVVIVLIAIVYGVWSARSSLGSSDAARLSGDDIMFVEADTNKTFTVTPYVGMVPPLKGPSGKPAFPGEACFWTASGKTKTNPTWVLMKNLTIAEGKEPTFCPDCGRLVVTRNPHPGDASTPPPTKAEWDAKHSK